MSIFLIVKTLSPLLVYFSTTSGATSAPEMKTTSPHQGPAFLVAPLPSAPSLPTRLTASKWIGTDSENPIVLEFEVLRDIPYSDQTLWNGDWHNWAEGYFTRNAQGPSKLVLKSVSTKQTAGGKNLAHWRAAVTDLSSKMPDAASLFGEFAFVWPIVDFPWEYGSYYGPYLFFVTTDCLGKLDAHEAACIRQVHKGDSPKSDKIFVPYHP